VDGHSAQFRRFTKCTYTLSDSLLDVAYPGRLARPLQLIRQSLTKCRHVRNSFISSSRL